MKNVSNLIKNILYLYHGDLRARSLVDIKLVICIFCNVLLIQTFNLRMYYLPSACTIYTIDNAVN